MATSRTFKIGVFDTATPLATGATVTATTPTPILYGACSASVPAAISAIRVGVIGASSFPSNASIIASINIVTGTVAGGNTATAVQLSGPTQAAATTWKTAGGTSAAAITGLTLSTFLWSQEIPFSAGSNWGEWVTPSFEITLAVSAIFALYITESSAGTATTFGGELEFSE